jgi:hypothetical protein
MAGSLTRLGLLSTEALLLGFNKIRIFMKPLKEFMPASSLNFPLKVFHKDSQMKEKLRPWRSQELAKAINPNLNLTK